MSNTKRELPTIDIKGTAFIVDVENNQFRECGNESNSFSFNQMEYKGTHYEMAYDERLKNPTFASKLKCTVEIPLLIQIDPEGIAKKYGVSETDLIGKNDFDFRVDQQIYTERVYLGRLPMIDIAGDTFFVDMRFDELRWTKDISKLIILRDQDRVELKGDYFFFYDTNAKQAVTIDSSVTVLPENVVKVILPEDHVLDPLVHAQITDVFRPNVGVNEVKDILMKCPFHKDLKAEVIPLSKTELVEIMKVNKAAKQDPLLKKNRESTGRDKGKHM